MKNPIQSRLRAREIENIAKTLIGSKYFSWLALIYAILIIILSGWLPDGLAEIFEHKGQCGIHKLLLSLLILFIIVLSLMKASKYKSRLEVKCEPPLPSKILVIFLSPLKRKLKPDDLKKDISILSDKTLEDRLVGTEWEMPWRAIQYHYDSKRLVKVYVIASKETSELMPLFEEVINRLFPSLEVEEFLKGGIDFQDIKIVFETIENLYNKLGASGTKNEDIIMDVTSGQVTNSIAGAIATLTLGRKFQYVSTRDKKVLSYDIGYFED